MFRFKKSVCKIFSIKYLKTIKTSTNSPAFFNSLKQIIMNNTKIKGLVIGDPLFDEKQSVF